MRDHPLLGKFSAGDMAWKPTMRLRFFQVGERTAPVRGKIVPGAREPVLELQQCWISSAGAEEWRAVPQVFHPAPTAT